MAAFTMQSMQIFARYAIKPTKKSLPFCHISVFFQYFCMNKNKIAMIDNIITSWLRSNKRLVVPEFGAFIHKDDGEVVFVEFLKKDDGVLTGLLQREYATDETEARGIIDEYVFNIRRTVGATGKYAVEGLGTLRTDANGLYALLYDPRVRREHIEIPVAPVVEQAPEPEEPVMRVVTREAVAEEKPAPSVSDDIIMDVRKDEAERGERPGNTIEFVFPTREPVREPEPAEQPQPEEKKVFTLNDLYAIPSDGERPEERTEKRTEQRIEERTVERPSPRPAAHPKPQERPAGHPRGHEPRPANDAHRYDGRPAEHPRHEGRPAEHPRNHAPHPADSVRHHEARPAANAPHPQQRRPQPRPMNRRRQGRSKTDWVMIVAIAVALFALGTIVYDMFFKPNPDIKPTNDQIENVEFIDGDTNVDLPENEG